MFGDHSTMNTFYDVDEELGSKEEYRILNFFGRRALSTEPQNCSFGDVFTEMNLNACCTCSTSIFPRILSEFPQFSVLSSNHKVVDSTPG